MWKPHHLLPDLSNSSPSSVLVPTTTKSGLSKFVSQILSLPCLTFSKSSWSNGHPLLAAAGLSGLWPHHAGLSLWCQPCSLQTLGLAVIPSITTLCLLQMSPLQRGLSQPPVINILSSPPALLLIFNCHQSTYHQKLPCPLFIFIFCLCSRLWVPWGEDSILLICAHTPPLPYNVYGAWWWVVSK